MVTILIDEILLIFEEFNKSISVHFDIHLIYFKLNSMFEYLEKELEVEID